MKRQRNTQGVKPAYKNLLQSYTYFLNNELTCSITMGFDLEKYSSTIIFLRIGQMAVEINYNDWLIYYKKHKQLDEKRLNNFAQLHEDLYINTILETSKIGYPLEFGEKDTQKRFYIKKREYEVFSNLVDFIQAVVSYNDNAKENINEYIDKYFKKCIEKRTTQLGQEDFYIPMQLHATHCNYSRLFYEIPIFLHKKIYSIVYN